MQRRRARPDPVSCQSCRSKKLRCNRIQPCSNCAARSITCNFIVPPQPESASTIQYNTEILGRIERLESLILPKHTSESNQLSREPTPPLNPEDTAASSVNQKGVEDLHLLENIGIREDSLVCIPSYYLSY